MVLDDSQSYDAVNPGNSESVSQGMNKIHHHYRDLHWKAEQLCSNGYRVLGITSLAMLEACFGLPDDALVIYEPKIAKTTCSA